MDRLEAMGVFLAVADTGSFARAARHLRVSAPAVTRAVAFLEERLGARLFTRTTRVVRVTAAGALFLEDVRRILADVAEAEGAAAGSHAVPKGELTITAPVLFGQLYVTPILLAFLDEFPGMIVRALFLDRVVNLVEEGMDVAVRIGELPDSSLTAARVGHVRRVVCGSPGYMARRGQPAHPDELAGHRVVVSSGISTAKEWEFDGTDGPIAVRIAPALAVNTNEAAITAAVAGFGLTRVLSYQVAAHIAAGRLITVLDDYQVARLPIHVVHQEGRRVSARVRALVDYLARRLRADPSIGGKPAPVSPEGPP